MRKSKIRVSKVKDLDVVDGIFFEEIITEGTEISKRVVSREKVWISREEVKKMVELIGN